MAARLARAELVAGLAGIVGPEHVSTSQADLVAYSADFWPKAQIWKLAGDVQRYPPDCVVWPADEAEIAAVLGFCNEHNVPVVPYGGGSGVCGGTVPISGGVTVDVKRLNQLLEVDDASLIVRCQAGINGQRFEDKLNARGLSLGHFPSSIACSTLGGWLAARSGGQFSSKYGKIEDMVLSLRVVFPNGDIRDTGVRGPGAPDWTQLIVGSEGTLGIITEASLKVHPIPNAQRLRGYRFRNLHDGFEGMRAVMQSGLRPIVVRLYDPFDSMLALGKQRKVDRHGDEATDSGGGAVGALRRMLSERTGPSDASGDKSGGGGLLSRLSPLADSAKRRALTTALRAPNVLNRLAHSAPSPCLMIIGFDGEPDGVAADSWSAGELLAEAGGTDAGTGPGEAWLKHRYSVAFKQAKMFEMGAFVDTMEVATTWDRLESLYQAVRKAVRPHAFVMAHFSHAYREGCSIYFTFAAYHSDPLRAEQLYDTIWNAASEATLRAGATLSHHHGVGLSKRKHMVGEHGAMVHVWRALKDSVDPRGIMNPGKLFTDESFADPTHGATA